MSNVNIWCIVCETRSVLKITIGMDKDLYDLRKAVLVELPNAENVKATQLTLWKVDIPSGILRNKDTSIEPYLTEKLEEHADTIEETICNVKGKNIRIVVKVSTDFSQQDITQVALGPDEIFENFLKSKHGQFLKMYIENNDPLPLYNSEILLKTSVPASFKGNSPSLLMYNLPGSDDNHEPITRVSDVQSIIAKQKNNLLIFLGTSGCGKTRTCYELICQNWGIYFVASRHGNGGSADIEQIESNLIEKITQDFEKNRQYAVEIVCCAILSRLLILQYCINYESAFNKQRWLLLQTCQQIFGKKYGYFDDMFLYLMLQLNTCTSLSVKNYINTIYTELFSSESEKFVIILDEIQSLEMTLKGKFKSRTSEHECSLLSPIIQALREPASLMINHCVIPCSTGLGILSLEDVINIGISKPDIETPKFTEFGGWQNMLQVKNYVSNLIELKDCDYDYLYSYFRGRFRPLITCVEDIIIGTPVEDAINATWKLLTMKGETSAQSLYDNLDKIVQRDRPNYLLSTNVLDLYKRVTLVYYYSGAPFLFTDLNQMTIVESGFGCIQEVNPSSMAKLKNVYKHIDNYMLLTSSVDGDSLCPPAIAGKKSLVAYVNEPFALTAAFNYFNDHNSLPRKILDTMSVVNNASSCGYLWETYLTTEFEKIFDGHTNIRDMLMFAGIEELPNTFIGSPRIVKSSNPLIKRVANSAFGYTLNDFFNEKPKLRPTFYFPDFFCGPDLIFFIEFENQIEVPVFVQLKLRYTITLLIENALSALHPTMFYRRSDGKMTREEINKPVINKITELCENVGSIGIFVAYPADVYTKIPMVTNNTHNLREKKSRFLSQQIISGHSEREQQHDQSTEEQKQLIGIIDCNNASYIFQKDHLTFLDALKNTMNEREVDELKELKELEESEELEEMKVNDNESRKRKKE